MTVSDWEAFHTAQVDAAAALGGLVFVGLSLNLKKILSYAALPSRALLALLVLLLILIVSSFMLMPAQSLTVLAMEIAAIGFVFWAIGTAIEVYTLRNVALRNRRAFIGNLVLLEHALLPYVVGGVLLMLGVASGFYWIAAAVIVFYVRAVLDAWAFLVEINR